MLRSIRPARAKLVLTAQLSGAVLSRPALIILAALPLWKGRLPAVGRRISAFSPGVATVRPGRHGDVPSPTPHSSGWRELGPWRPAQRPVPNRRGPAGRAQAGHP